jgi:succinylglutamate desuccinylase
LDIHTTSSFGGIFVIPGDSSGALSIAKDMNAPVVTGLLNDVTGTTMHFFNKNNIGQNIDAITFEAGQHTEVLSVNRAIAAIINCMKSIEMVSHEDVENIHNEILIKYSEGLPKVTEITFKYSLNKGDFFEMVPGFKNFELVKKGDLLAHNDQGEVRAPHDARLLMPLYQKLGSEGFFLVRELQEDK